MSLHGARSTRLAWALPALMLCAVAAPRAALAHGGVSIENDRCKLRVGPYVMHFTGYQPQSAAEREFCEDIPSTGLTIIVLDYIDEKLRDLPVDVRIIRDTSDESDLESVTVYHQAAKLYPRGTVSVETTFAEPGRFVGIVTAGDQASRFPFAVGTGGRRRIVLYGLFAAVATVAAGLLFYYSSSRTKKG